MKNVVLVFLGVAAAVAVGFWISGYHEDEPKQEGNITVDAPRSGDTVGALFDVTGEARTFEQNVQWRLTDGAGRELASGFTTAAAQEIGMFGPYSFTVAVPPGSPPALSVQVYESSAQDGSEINKVSVPVVFIP